MQRNYQESGLAYSFVAVYDLGKIGQITALRGYDAVIVNGTGV